MSTNYETSDEYGHDHKSDHYSNEWDGVYCKGMPPPKICFDKKNAVVRVRSFSYLTTSKDPKKRLKCEEKPCDSCEIGYDSSSCESSSSSCGSSSSGGHGKHKCRDVESREFTQQLRGHNAEEEEGESNRGDEGRRHRDRHLRYGKNFNVLEMKSNGVFLKQHCILVPASTVILPPDILTKYNRYPFKKSQICDKLNGDAMVRVNNIFVDVYGVNGRQDEVITYEAELMGVYGIGGVALLRIDMECFPTNRNLPKIRKSHPYFRWGCSRSLYCGEPVYSYGDAFTNVLPNSNSSLPLLDLSCRVFLEDMLHIVDMLMLQDLLKENM